MKKKTRFKWTTGTVGVHGKIGWRLGRWGILRSPYTGTFSDKDYWTIYNMGEVWEVKSGPLMTIRKIIEGWVEEGG